MGLPVYTCDKDLQAVEQFPMLYQHSLHYPTAGARFWNNRISCSSFSLPIVTFFHEDAERVNKIDEYPSSCFVVEKCQQDMPSGRWNGYFRDWIPCFFLDRWELIESFTLLQVEYCSKRAPELTVMHSKSSLRCLATHNTQIDRKLDGKQLNGIASSAIISGLCSSHHHSVTLNISKFEMTSWTT